MAYGISVSRLEQGWDVEKVFSVAGREIEELRTGLCPRFLEIQTFRYMEHVGPGSDIGKGPRTLQSLHEWQSRDPLTEMEPEISVHADIEKELAEAIDFAEKSSFPNKRDLLEDVY